MFLMKKIIKKIIKSYLSKNDQKILNFFLEKKIYLNLCDIGSLGGMQKKWKLFEKLINFYDFEPQADVSSKNKFVLSNENNLDVDLNITKKLQCSSVLEPNINHLKRFKSVDRFEILKKEKFKTITFDEFYADKNLDFIKIDCEGYEFEILQGAQEYLNKKYVLGLEVECEFFQLRSNQALFWDIKNYLEKKGYIFYDFLKIIRWEKDQYSEMGQPQITDALFLKNPEKLIDDFKDEKIGKDVILKYYLILSVFNKSDLIRYINKSLDFNEKKYLDFVKQTSAKSNLLNKFRQLSRKIEMLFGREI
tara:strand:- start:335 stop:1252 length:918 start_codon:yes stop_codon:yes gene_type:complete